MDIFTKKLILVAILIFIVNLPFGYWRARSKKFSRNWFLAIHLPVPIVIALRILSHLGWRFITFPVFIGAFFVGQFTGGLVEKLHRNPQS